MTGERRRLQERQGRLWLGLAACALGAVLVWWLLPLDAWAGAFQGWIRGLGYWGPLAYVALYVLGALLFTPGSILSIVGGLAFGAWAFPLVLAAATIAGALAFLIARYLARARFEALFEHHPKFEAIDRAVEEEGWKVVALLRLSPLIPYNLQNYALGLTSVGFRAYVAATFFGIMPGAALFVYLGRIGQVAGAGEGGAVRWAFFAVGLLATLAVAILIGRRASATLGVAGLDPARV